MSSERVGETANIRPWAFVDQDLDFRFNDISAADLARLRAAYEKRGWPYTLEVGGEEVFRG